MPRSRFTLLEKRQVAHAGAIYPYRNISTILGCGKSSVHRYVQADQSDLPPPKLGRPPRITQDDIDLVERCLCENRHLNPPCIVSLLIERGLVISESTLRRNKRGTKPWSLCCTSKTFVDDRARGLRIEYATAHVSDDQDTWKRTIFCDESILCTNGAVRTYVTPGQERNVSLNVWSLVHSPLERLLWYGEHFGKADAHVFIALSARRTAGQGEGCLLNCRGLTPPIDFHAVMLASKASSITDMNITVSTMSSMGPMEVNATSTSATPGSGSSIALDTRVRQSPLSSNSLSSTIYLRLGVLSWPLVRQAHG